MKKMFGYTWNNQSHRNTKEERNGYNGRDTRGRVKKRKRARESRVKQRKQTISISPTA